MEIIDRFSLLVRLLAYQRESLELLILKRNSQQPLQSIEGVGHQPQDVLVVTDCVIHFVEYSLGWLDQVDNRGTIDVLNDVLDGEFGLGCCVDRSGILDLSPGFLVEELDHVHARHLAQEVEETHGDIVGSDGVGDEVVEDSCEDLFPGLVLEQVFVFEEFGEELIRD